MRVVIVGAGAIGGGADEVMLQIIAKMMGTLPRLANR